MFTKEKYCKSSQTFNNTTISKNIISSNKFHPKTFIKNKKQNNKKNKCDRLWKKQSSNIYWSEKENDKNNLNYSNYNKKTYYNNKRKIFKYQKKISNSDLIFDSSFISENSNNNKFDNGNFLNLNKHEYNNKDEILKDEKNNSFEYTTTYSNSFSTQEESNNNIINMKESLDNINKCFSFVDQPNIINKNKSQNIYENKILNNEKDLNLKEQIISTSMKNINYFKLNSCPNLICELPSLSSTQIPQIQNMKKYSDNIKSEPYNKYNSINQDLNQPWINPIAENTEILNVNVKISKNKNVVFKLRRFDDLFLTVKLFCEINSIDEKFMKPIIIKALCALNNIYQIINTQLDEKNIKKLKLLNTFFKNTFI